MFDGLLDEGLFVFIDDRLNMMRDRFCIIVGDSYHSGRGGGVRVGLLSLALGSWPTTRHTTVHHRFYMITLPNEN